MSDPRPDKTSNARSARESHETLVPAAHPPLPVPALSGDCVPRITLTVVAGPDEGRRLSTEVCPISIGTAEGNHLRLTDPLVSRRHCQLVFADDGVVLRDTASRNGTFVNGVRIFDAALESAAQVWLGETRIRFDLGSESKPSLPPASDRFGDLLGASPAMRGVFATLRSIAPTTLTCLLLGETGTGKELAARAVHVHSSYARGPFIVIDLGAVSEALIEDKLFGHERGAFTGAQNVAKGAFEDANGGTVFLDEIGELPLALQSKLLRVLERREITRLGSHRPIPCDIRVIAATHRDLESMVARGAFRQDLYYRISEASVRIPPLRERLEDIELLARHMLTQEWSKPAALTASAVQALRGHQWPGNVRELRNVLRRANATSLSGSIDVALLAEFLPPEKETGFAPEENEVTAILSGKGLGIAQARDEHRKEYMTHLLQQYGDDHAAIARHMGVHIKYARRLLRRYSLIA